MCVCVCEREREGAYMCERGSVQVRACAERLEAVSSHHMYKVHVYMSDSRYMTYST